MKELRDIHELLRQYGTWIYTGNSQGDLLLMEEELHEMFRLGLIDAQKYKKALLILKRERNEKREKG